MLGEAKDLEAGPMLAFRAGVGQGRGLETEAAPEQQAGADTSAAYAAFWKPLEPAIASAKRIYVAPDGVLNTIPIGLMATADGRLVMEKYQLRIVNSTKDLLRMASLSPSKQAVLVGNPKFDLTVTQQREALAQLNGDATPEPNPETSVQYPDRPAAVGSSGGELKGGNLNSLPGTQLEVDTVDKLLKNAGWKAETYTGDRALKQVVTHARSPRVMHLATHGFFLTDEELTRTAAAQGKKANLDEDPMLRSGLFFAGGDRVRSGETAAAADVDDGVLTAYEASQINFEGTELVVLSARETGLGKELNSNGVFGLRRAFAGSWRPGCDDEHVVGSRPRNSGTDGALLREVAGGPR